MNATPFFMVTLCYIPLMASWLSTAFMWVGWIAYMSMVLAVSALVVMENRNPLKSLAWLMVLIFIPGLGLLLYLVFGRSMRNHRMISRRRHRRLFDDVSRKRGKGDCKPVRTDDEVARQLISLGNAVGCFPVSGGNTVTVYDRGGAKFDALMADIRDAEKYILLQYYIFSDDELGERVASLLCDKARNGVRVCVIYDHLACLGVKKSFFEELRSSGVEAYPFFKLTFPHLASRANWRNHRKLCVIDGVVGYTGGMNIAKRYVDGGDFGFWRDYHLRITGEAVGALQLSFAVDWNFMGRPLLDLKPYAGGGVAPGRIRDVGMQFVTSGPTDPWNRQGLFLLRAISMAKHRVWIETPYFSPPEALLKALQAAALARVDVRILIPERSDSVMLTYAARSFIQECVQAGVKIYFYKKGMLHSKVVVVDGDVVSIGSANLDFRSLEHNFEGNMWLYSRQLNRIMARKVLRDIEESERVNRALWRTRPVGMKAAESVLRLFSPIL